MIEVTKDKKALKTFNDLAKSMIEANKLVDSQIPNWVPETTIASLSADQGRLIFNGKGVVFETLPKEISILQGKSLKLRGTGPVIRICVAVASRTETYRFNGVDYTI